MPSVVVPLFWMIGLSAARLLPAHFSHGLPAGIQPRADQSSSAPSDSSSKPASTAPNSPLPTVHSENSTIPHSRSCSSSHNLLSSGSITVNNFYGDTNITVSMAVVLDNSTSHSDRHLPGAINGGHARKGAKKVVTQHLALTPSPSSVDLSSDSLPYFGCLAALVDRVPDGKYSRDKGEHSGTVYRPPTQYTNADSNNNAHIGTCVNVLPVACVRDLTRASEEYAKANLGSDISGSEDGGKVRVGAQCEGLKIPRSCPFALAVVPATIGNPTFARSQARVQASSKSCNITSPSFSSKEDSPFSKAGTVPAGTILNPLSSDQDSDSDPLPDGDDDDDHDKFDDLSTDPEFQSTLRSSLPLIMLAWSRNGHANWSTNRIFCLTPSEIAANALTGNGTSRWDLEGWEDGAYSSGAGPALGRFGFGDVVSELGMGGALARMLGSAGVWVTVWAVMMGLGLV